MRNLSKSKLIAFRQCPKRLWLEVHHRKLSEDSGQTQASFRTGHQIGAIARRLYDPFGRGTLIDAQSEGHGPALARSQSLLASPHPLFEAGFAADGALAYADVMLPVRRKGQRAWRMVEVKSSTEVKPYHCDDIAIQAFVARSAGVPLASIALAYVDKTWTYPGGGDYDGLLMESDLTKEAFARHDEVKSWVAEAQAVVARKKEPTIRTGTHCTEPFECGFLAYCQSQEPQPRHPITWLPKVATKALKVHIEANRLTELRDAPDDLLNKTQLRVKKHTLSGKIYFDAKGAAADLATHTLPVTFLDFETVSSAVPLWKGARPYQQIPFQFSAHRLSRTGTLTHTSFLDLSGRDPSRAFAEALLQECGRTGPVYVYGAACESTHIIKLAKRYPRLREGLLRLSERVFDLLPVARQRYYHPEQQGKWSIKLVLPAIAPDLTYEALDEIQEGMYAMEAFQEAIAPTTTPERKAQIERQLLAYCRLDTYAMVRLWAFFSGRPAPAD